MEKWPLLLPNGSFARTRGQGRPSCQTKSWPIFGHGPTRTVREGGGQGLTSWVDQRKDQFGWSSTLTLYYRLRKARTGYIEGELEGNFLDKLQCPTADGVLRALRKCFSLAYPDEHSDESFKQAVTQIGDVAREALLPVGDDVLTSLRPKPVGQPPPEPKIKVHVILFVFAGRPILTSKPFTRVSQ